MAIITKPAGGVLKGIPATFTLNKVELLALSAVSSDSYFSNSDNWNKVILKYKSSEGRQYEVVEFNATQASPTGFFSVSEKARNLFEIQTLEIIDFDGGIFIVPRGSLTTSDFDVSFSSTPAWIVSALPRLFDGTNIVVGDPNSPVQLALNDTYSVSVSANFVNIEQVDFNLASITVFVDGTEVYNNSWSAFNYSFFKEDVSGQTKSISLKLSLQGHEDYTTPACDFAFPSVGPQLSYINWDLLTGYAPGSLTITETSGVSGGSSLSGNDVAVKSDANKATGDFDYTFKFDWSSASNIIDMFIGVTANNITAGTSFYVGLSCIYGGSNNPDIAYFWQQQSPVGNNQNLINGENIYRIQRVGLTINHYLNGNLVYSSVTGSIFTAYPTVRTMGNSVVNEAYITEAPTVPSSFSSINSQEVPTSETGGWVLYNGNYYNTNDGATRIVQRLGSGSVRALGVILSDGGPTSDGMEWVPTSVTISGGNSSSSFTQIKTFSLVRSDFTADTLKYLVLDSDQSFEFYRITFNSYDKTYGGSLFIQGQVSLHTAN